MDLVSKTRARYRNAVMGFVWAVLQPLVMMLILYFVFGVIFQRPGLVSADGREHHYALTLLTALIFWQFFASALSRATVSLIENADLIKKVYFPREIIPLASMGNSVVNLAIGFAVLIALHVYLKAPAGIGVFYVGFVFAIQCILLVGLALLCASLNVRFRDVGYAVEVGLMMGFYATPIFYSVQEVQNAAPNHPLLISFYFLNPLVGIITSYRTALLENSFPSMREIGWPIACSLALLVIGVVVFRRASPTVADHL